MAKSKPRAQGEILDSATKGVVAGLLADYAKTSLYDNPGLKGRARERMLVGAVVETYLPRNLQAVQGVEVADSDGKSSGECDIVIHDPRVPPLSVDPPTKKLIVEAVYGVIEVKSRLTLAELRDSHKKIVRVKSLTKKAWEGPPNQINALSYERSWMASPVHGFVVAFAGTKLKSLRKELDRLNSSLEVHMRVDSLWVLDSGFVVNWNDGSSSIEPLPDHATRLRAGKTSNPVALLIAHLNQLYQQIETPPIRFDDYGVHPLSPDEWID